MKTKVTNDSVPDQSGTSVPFAPEKVANLGINYSLPFGFQISPYLNYNAGYYDSNSKSGRKFFKPGTLLNINASQVLAKAENYKVEAFGNFYNVTNNKYEMPWQFRNPGFSFMAGIRATF